MYDRITNKVNRISWGAIFAGTVSALAISTMLNLLGAGIGFSSIDIMDEVHPLAGLGIGTLIWWGISNLIALFAGGYIAGRVSGYPSKEDGGIHGFMTWALFGIVSFILITSAVNSVVSGIGGAVGSIFGGNNNKEVTVNLQNAQQSSQDQVNTSMKDIQQSVYSVVRKAEQLNILPDDASEEMRQTQQNLQGEGQQLINSMNLDQTVSRFFNTLDFNVDNDGNLKITSEGDLIDKNGLKEYLINNTQLSEKEIDGMIQKWEAKFQNAIDKAEKLYDKALQKAAEIANKTAEIAAKVAISAFVILLLGAIVAYLGGRMGSPNHLIRDDEDIDDVAYDKDRDIRPRR